MPAWWASSVDFGSGSALPSATVEVGAGLGVWPGCSDTEEECSGDGTWMPTVDAAWEIACWAGAGRAPAAARPPVAAAVAIATPAIFANSDANNELSTVLLLHFGDPDAWRSGSWALIAGLTPGLPLSTLRRVAS